MKLRRGKQGKLLKDTAVQCYILKDRRFGDVSQSTTIARLATTTREEVKGLKRRGVLADCGKGGILQQSPNEADGVLLVVLARVLLTYDVR